MLPSAPTTPRIIARTRRLTLRRRKNEVVPSQGNQVHLLRHGGDFFAALFAALQAASACIRAEFYLIRDDATGAAFAEALLAAASRGVEVFLIYDFIGCIDTPVAYFRRLEQGGIRCLAFNRPTFRRLRWLDVRDHRKIVTIDGRTAFTGGLNVGDEYSGYGENPKRWRDIGIRLDGPAAGILDALFRTTWSAEGNPVSRTAPMTASRQADAGDAEIIIINGTPHHSRSVIRTTFRLAMAGAVEGIMIATPYFLPGPRILRAMLRAAARGVRVQLILPSITDVPLVKLLSQAYLSPLLKAGVEVFERQGTILHAKVMAVDNRWVTVGSANLDLRSFHRNYELNVIVHSRRFGAEMAATLEDDLARSWQLTLGEHDRRSLFARILERLFDPIGRFL